MNSKIPTFFAVVLFGWSHSAITEPSLPLYCSFDVARGRIHRKTWCIGPYAGVDYNLISCPLQSRLQHIYYEQPYARVDHNPMPCRVDFIPRHASGILDLASVHCTACLCKLIIRRQQNKRRPPPIHCIPFTHKVLIYIEHHSVCPLVGIGTPPPL